MWGGEPFWGLGSDWDPDWVLTPKQVELRDLLIELCEKEMRDNAKSRTTRCCSRARTSRSSPSTACSALVPKEYGGMGQNHVCLAMVCETIARYGCASTAMCYTMHMGAVDAALLRAHRGADQKTSARWTAA